MFSGISGERKSEMNKTKGLNANQLKLIAIIAMTIDHVVWTVCPGYSTVWWVVILYIIFALESRLFPSIRRYLTRPVLCGRLRGNDGNFVYRSKSR